ncbi:MAG: hypothetical protein KAH48_09155, partial [Chlorobi bacterium]|nr:hypothetical protein [Chlorobiota bacterium]
NINDTSFTTGKFTLGASRKYYLRTNPQEPHKYQNSYDRSSLYLSRITIMNGSPSFEFDYFVRNAGKNHISYYEPQSRKYKIYDISKDSVLGTLLGEGTSSRYVTSSYNGKYIAYFEAGNVNIVEDLNVDNTKAYSTSILTNGAFSSESGKRVLSGLTVSDNGLMSVSCSNMIFLYDLSKNKYINSFVCEDYRPGSSYLSYDGKFLVGQDGNGKYICYKIENDELIKLFILDEHHFIDFNQKETNKILVRHKKTDLFQLICIDPYSVLKELNSNDDLIGVDAHNSTFATGTSNSVKVYSLDNLQLIKEISTVRIPAQSFYKNNTIYFEEGFKIDLGD